ncbi:MAG: glycosyltransferase family 4 protein [Bacteroidetes bacterium]|nr:glycosyltransferase family 4 protein [Bacteroidota bacterium]MBS1648424.1 glycosyltransferase family 4 protein [Bacteroidota bacterium]
MISGKTIYIAHNWINTTVNIQSKILAIDFSENNEVVFLSAKKTGHHNNTIKQNLTVYEWPGKRPTGLKDFIFLFKLMKKKKPDIIISSFAANNIMLLVSWLFNVKYRCCFYQTIVDAYIEDHHGKLGWIQKLKIIRKKIIFGIATHILTPSQYGKKDLIKYFEVNEKKVYVFPNSVPSAKQTNTSNNQTIAFIGRLNRTKGADILVKAFIKIANDFPEVVLLIAGDGDQYKELKNEINNATLQNRIILEGNISYNKVYEILQHINYLVVPSRADNFPTTILEAFSVGTPVVGSNSGGIPEMIIDGHNGLLFEKENVDDLANKLKQMFSNKPERDKMAVNAKQIFEEKYRTETVKNRIEILLENN